jgi:hypothetical protein
MEWVIAPLIIALIVTGAKAFQAWVVWKKHRLEETERLRKFTGSLRTDLILTAPKFPTTYSPPPVPSAGVVLASEVGADYTKLRDLLVAQKYKEADQETARVMLWVASRGKKWLEFLDPESINEFPCSDLRTIDQLWVQNSNGYFGFSIQKEIYNQAGENWIEFAYQVGWMNGEEFKSYEQYTFEISALKGHLPAVGWCWDSMRCYGTAGVWFGGGRFTLFSRRDL